MKQLDTEVLQEFKGRYLDTIVWCSAKRPYSNIQSGLRTTALKPNIPEWPSFEELDSSLTTLVKQRHLLLSRYGILDKTAISQKDQGKLLICEFNFSFSSGESEAKTGGFFDINDRPPWDTWLFCLQKKNEFHPNESIELLISWVPPDLLSLAQTGIEINPYGCIYWAHDSNDELIRQLNQHTLLC